MPRMCVATPGDDGVPLEGDRQRVFGFDRRDASLLAALAIGAFALRAAPVLFGAGLFGLHGYDDGVYFGAATALVHGVMPYRDFLLLHPPGLVVLLAPLAALGNLIGDPAAFALARVSIMLLGAVNTVLVALIAGRYDRLAGLTAAALYATWSTASNFERTTDLHAPQSTLVLIALLALAGRERVGARPAAVAGVALGLATSVQLWQAASVAVVLVWLVLRTRDQAAGRLRPILGFLAGSAAAFGAVCMPFLVAAPEEMVRYMIVDQVSRPNLGVGVIDRLRVLEGFPQLDQLPPMLRRLVPDAVVVLAAAAGAALVVITAWRCPWTRLWAALAIVQSGIVLATPAFHNDYAAFMAPAAALVLGTGIAIAIGRAPRRGPWPVVARGASIALLVVLGSVSLVRLEGQPLRLADLERDLSEARCISSDSPALLVLTSGLRRDLDNGCPLVVDPDGVVYDTDRGQVSVESGEPFACTPPVTRLPCSPGTRAVMPRCSRGPRADCQRRPGPRSRDGCRSSTATASSPCDDAAPIAWRIR